MGGVGGDEYLYPKEDGRGEEEGRKGSSSLPSCGVGGAAAMIVLPRGVVFIDKKGLKVVFGGGAARRRQRLSRWNFSHGLAT